MAAASSTNVKLMVTSDWKQIFDSALENPEYRNEKSRAPIYRRAKLSQQSPEKDQGVDIAAKALAALWGTRVR